VAIPSHSNVVQKEGEKKLKYKILCIDIQRTCNLKCKIIPGTGILTKVLKTNLEAISRKHSVDSLQRTAYTWNITHITHKVQQSET